jgi:hypothetical protein
MNTKPLYIELLAVLPIALACADTPTSIPDASFGLVHDGAIPVCAGRAAAIYQDVSGAWVLPPGASATPWLPGGFDVYGTSGDDVIVGSVGSDRITPRLGDDIVCAGPGNDAIEDGGGNDRLFGELGNDHVLDGEGVDRLDGGEGNDVLYGGPDNDEMFGGPGDDRLEGFGGGFPVQPRDFANGGTGTDFCDTPKRVNCET